MTQNDHAKDKALSKLAQGDLTNIEDLVHLVGDGWLTEAFDLKDPDKLLDLIEHCEADIRKELQALIAKETLKARLQGRAAMYNELWDVVKESGNPAEGAIALMRRLGEMKDEITGNLDKLKGNIK